MKLFGWLRRERIAPVLTVQDLRPPKPLEIAMFGATFPDPATTQWPHICVADDPCGVKFDNDADRSYWYDCAVHAPRGRHGNAGRHYV